MRRFFLLGSFALAFLVTGCAVLPSYSGKQNSASGREVQVQASRVSFLEPAPAGSVRVVLMRPKTGNSGVLKVFQGTRFHADLQMGDFTVLSMCPSDTRFSVTSALTTDQNVQVKAPRTFEMTERLQAGQQRFYRVVMQESGDAGVQPLEQSVAEWVAMNRLLRLVASVEPDCLAAGATAQTATTTPLPATGAVTGAPVAAPGFANEAFESMLCWVR